MKAILTIDMPPTCFDCPFALWEYETLLTSNKHKKNSFACVLTHKTITSTKRSRFCPLKEMPKRKGLYAEMRQYDTDIHYEIGWNDCLKEIER